MPTLKVNYKIWEAVNKPQPIIVIIGGRGSGKSLGVGDCLAFEMGAKGYDIYCLREFQDSLSDSVHRVFQGAINDRLKLDGWDVQQSTVIAPNGAKTTYKGANRNPDAMQSAQGYMRSWFEEAHRASQSSLDKLLPTILRNPGAKCIFTANPQSSADPFSQRFIVPYLNQLDTHGFYEDELHYIVVVNWRDNPWWNEEQERLRKWDFENLSRAKYDWIWEGKFLDTVDNAIIHAEWFDAAIDAHKLDRLKDVFKPHGAVVAAHDPFDDGGDAGGLVIRHGSIIKAVKTKTSGEIDEVCDWATGQAKQYAADWFVWDGDGMGAGLKRQVSLAFDGTHTNYHIFKGSLAGKGQDNAEDIYMPMDGDKDTEPKTYAETFKNNRAQYYVDLANRFYNTYRCVVKGGYIDPDMMISIDSGGVENMAGLKSEVCRIPTKPNANGLIQIMSKEEMKSIDIASPNQADSLMMSLFKPPQKTQFAPLDYKRKRYI